MADDPNLDQLEWEIKKLAHKIETTAREERAAIAQLAESRCFQLDAIQQSLNQIFRYQQQQFKRGKDPSHESDSRANKNSEKDDVQQEQRPQFINTSANSVSISIQIQKTNSDPEISSSDSSTQVTQHDSSSTISESKFSASKIQIQQIQKQQFKNIISTISESTTIIEGGESRSVAQKLQISSNNSIKSGTDYSDSSGTAVGAFATEEGERRDTSATNSHAVAAATSIGDPRTSGGGLNRRVDGLIASHRRVLPIATKPPLLMAAVFPWDRECAVRMGKKQDEVMVMVTGAVRSIDSAMDGGTRSNHFSPWCLTFAEEEARKKKARATGGVDVLAPVTGGVPPVVACCGGGVVGSFVHRTFWKEVQVKGVWANGLINDWSGSGFSLGPIRIGKAQREKHKQNSLISGPILQNAALFGQLKVFVATQFRLLLVDGSRFYQWDPGGISNFWDSRIEIK